MSPDPARSIEILAETPHRLAAVVIEHAPETLRERVRPDVWSPNEIIGHLADTEWAYGVRLRTAVGSREPVIRGFDQEGWVASRDLRARDPAEQLEAFVTLRRLNLAEWRGLDATQLARVYTHERRGPEPVAALLRAHASHDLAHLDQIARYLKQITAS